MAYRNDVEIKNLRPGNEKDLAKLIQFHQAGNLCATRVIIDKVSPNEKLGREAFLKLLETRDETAIETILHKADVTTEYGDELLRALVDLKDERINFRIVGICNIRNEACRALLAYIYKDAGRQLRIKISDMANPDNQAGMRFIDKHLRMKDLLDRAREIDPNTEEGSAQIIALFEESEMIGFNQALRAVNPNTEYGSSVLFWIIDNGYRKASSVILSKADCSNDHGRRCMRLVADGKGNTDERKAAKKALVEWADPDTEEVRNA